MARMMQIFCILVSATAAIAAKVPNTVFWPANPFHHAHSDTPTKLDGDVQIEVVTTLGPREDSSDDTTEASVFVTVQDVSSDLLKIEAPLEQEPEPAKNEAEPEMNLIPNMLINALSRSGLDPALEDPLLEEAKKQYISTWNLEALRQNAPYLMIDRVWPDLGMVYMPAVNQMTAKVQKSKMVKEAALSLKRIWEEVNQGETSAITEEGNIFEAFAQFFNNLYAQDRLRTDGEANLESGNSTQKDGRPSDKGPVNVNQDKIE
ncbi:uncharacterized protein LOC125044266 [Penaeus chinensis]|uniref:uncharacterized protein LOC125044266 n=1 Tax=Penaeus chinensis TaxID=139456 RepID=UPI001FB7130E|nr:uncharacterized protein LOC125044266 [Penaeus chinensis]